MEKFNLVGKKFGRLTVTKNLGVRNKARYWECICSCGGVTEGWTAQLNSGRKNSCGCLRVENSKKSIENTRKSTTLGYGIAARNSLRSSYRVDSRRKGLGFNLSIQEFTEITQSDCAYCGSGPSHPYTYSKCNGPYIANGIDRIDNKIGYYKNNVVPCCKICNYMKNVLSVEQFLSHVDKINNHRKSKT